MEKGDVGGRGVEKEVGMSIDPDTYSPNIFVVERNTMFQQDLTKEGLWMLSSKGSLFFVFLGVRDQKGGEHGEQVGEEERGIYSKPGKGE